MLKIIAALWMLILCVLLFVNYNNFKRAKSLEKRGKYKEACFAYANTILRGFFGIQYCKKSIRYLWQLHGPFHYEGASHDSGREGILQEGGVAGQSATIAIIEEAISDTPDTEKKTPRDIWKALILGLIIGATISLLFISLGVLIISFGK
jgi:hypothetical protein